MLQQNHLAPASGDRRLPMLRDVLLSATAGKVRLCLDPAELKDPPAGAGPSYDLREETLGEFQVLRELGIHKAQGYLFGRPTSDWSTWNEWHQRGRLLRVTPG